ncbi:MAG: MBL fold metallo-hydrolase [Candidatus Caldatribacteriaceae bacterium]
MNMSLERFVLGAFLTNGYLLVAGEEAMLVDPATPSEEVKARIEREGLKLRYILNTHGHIDHIGGNAFFKACFPEARLIIHEKDLLYLQNPSLNLSLEVSTPYVSPSPDLVIRGGRESAMVFGPEEVLFLPTPGHTPGSLCLFLPRMGWLLSGDTLFAGSVGRVDLPGGSLQDLLASLAVIFARFPDDTLVYPGHGPETTIGDEKRENFYYLEYVATRP